nr:MAG TPA: hypothetical protein [Caudoviricetes sp.]
MIFLPYSVIIKAAGVRLPARLLGWKSGVLVRGGRSFLLLVHDAFYALTKLFQCLALLNKFEDCF